MFTSAMFRKGKFSPNILAAFHHMGAQVLHYREWVVLDRLAEVLTRMHCCFTRTLEKDYSLVISFCLFHFHGHGDIVWALNHKQAKCALHNFVIFPKEKHQNLQCVKILQQHWTRLCSAIASPKPKT